MNTFNYTGSRSTFNTVTSYLDASFVYGTSEDTAHSLRTNSGGLLKTNPVLSKLGLKELLPPKLDKSEGPCKPLSNDLLCFMSGDSRVNQQALLTIIHTIFLREHNRIAIELSQINPHWNDERLFQVKQSIHFISKMKLTEIKSTGNAPHYRGLRSAHHLQRILAHGAGQKHYEKVRARTGKRRKLMQVTVWRIT